MTNDKVWIIFGDLGLTDPHYGFIDHDATADKFSLNEIKLNQYFCAVANAGANGVRILPWSVWWERPYGIKSQFQAFGYLNGKFDLEVYNDGYFQTMKKIFDIAHEYNLMVWFPLLDNCQLSGNNFNQYSPWHNNVQGIDSFYDRAAEPHIAKWMRKCVSDFGTSDMFYPFGNECNDHAFEGICQRIIIPLAKDLGLDPNRLAYGATMDKYKYIGNGEYGEDASTLAALKGFMGDFWGEDAKLQTYREIHGCGSTAPDNDRPYGHEFHQALHWWGPNPIRKFLSDDGVRDGDSDCDKTEGLETGLSSIRCAGMVSYALKNYPISLGGLDHLLTFEHVPQGGNLACQCATLRAMADAYKEHFGKKMENVDRHIYTPPQPKPDPKPDVPKTCNCENWLLKGGDGKRDYWRYFLCKLGLGKKKCL